MDAAYLERREADSLSYRRRQAAQAVGRPSSSGATGDEGRLIVYGRFGTKGLELTRGYIGQTDDEERSLCEHDDKLVLRQLSGPGRAPWHSQQHAGNERHITFELAHIHVPGDKIVCGLTLSAALVKHAMLLCSATAVDALSVTEAHLAGQSDRRIDLLRETSAMTVLGIMLWDPEAQRDFKKGVKMTLCTAFSTKSMQSSCRTTWHPTSAKSKECPRLPVHLEGAPRLGLWRLVALRELMIARGKYGLPKTPGMGVNGNLRTSGASHHPSTKLGVADPGYLSVVRLHLSAVAREVTARYTATILAEDAKKTPSAANVAAAAVADARLRAAEQLRGPMREAAHIKADDLLFEGGLTYVTSLAHRAPLTALRYQVSSVVVDRLAKLFEPGTKQGVVAFRFGFDTNYATDFALACPEDQLPRYRGIEALAGKAM